MAAPKAKPAATATSAAKAKPKMRKKEKKNVAVGQAYIKSTFNNTIVSITDTTGAVIAWSSAGQVGFKGSRKSTPYAAQMAAADAAKAAADAAKAKAEAQAKAEAAAAAVASATAAVDSAKQAYIDAGGTALMANLGDLLPEDGGWSNLKVTPSVEPFAPYLLQDLYDAWQSSIAKQSAAVTTASTVQNELQAANEAVSKAAADKAAADSAAKAVTDQLAPLQQSLATAQTALTTASSALVAASNEVSKAVAANIVLPVCKIDV